MVVIVCKSDEDFRSKMASVGSKPVIVMYTLESCPACKVISPSFYSLSDSYSGKMVFLEADGRKCEAAAASASVSAYPTFIVYVNGNVVTSFKGANQERLEEAVKDWCQAETAMVPGFVQLGGNILTTQVEALNACDDTPFNTFLTGSNPVLRSDCDEQLILSIPFKQPIKLHSIFIKGKGGMAPKVVRVFVNLPKSLDFDDAQGIEPAQILEFTKTAGETGELQPLKYVKFQNVHSLQLFVENNQEGGDVTELNDLKLIGLPNTLTRMEDFQSVKNKD